MGDADASSNDENFRFGHARACGCSVRLGPPARNGRRRRGCWWSGRQRWRRRRRHEHRRHRRRYGGPCRSTWSGNRRGSRWCRRRQRRRGPRRGWCRRFLAVPSRRGLVSGLHPGHRFLFPGRLHRFRVSAIGCRFVGREWGLLARHDGRRMRRARGLPCGFRRSAELPLRRPRLLRALLPLRGRRPGHLQEQWNQLHDLPALLRRPLRDRLCDRMLRGLRAHDGVRTVGCLHVVAVRIDDKGTVAAWAPDSAERQRVGAARAVRKRRGAALSPSS